MLTVFAESTLPQQVNGDETVELSSAWREAVRPVNFGPSFGGILDGVVAIC